MKLRRILIIEAFLLGVLLIWNTFKGLFGSDIGSEVAFTDLLLLFVGVIVMGGTFLVGEVKTIVEKKHISPLQKWLLISIFVTIVVFFLLHFLR